MIKFDGNSRLILHVGINLLNRRGKSENKGGFIFHYNN